MKTQQLPKMLIAAFIVAISLNACGKSSSTPSTDTASQLSNNSCCSTNTFTNTWTNTSTSTNTNTGAGQAPLTFAINLNGSQAGQTPAIKTDNVLKFKFQVGNSQGNSYHQASELAVTITLNGLTFQPKFTDSNYTYGRVGEISNVIDASSNIQPGQNMVLTVGSPMNDFYCTYAPNPFYYWDGMQWAPTNPLYNNYPGCRKAVPSTQNWSGTLIVQTSETTAI